MSWYATTSVLPNCTKTKVETQTIGLKYKLFTGKQGERDVLMLLHLTCHSLSFIAIIIMMVMIAHIHYLDFHHHNYVPTQSSTYSPSNHKHRHHYHPQQPLSISVWSNISKVCWINYQTLVSTHSLVAFYQTTSLLEPSQQVRQTTHTGNSMSWLFRRTVVCTCVLLRPSGPMQLYHFDYFLCER